MFLRSLPLLETGIALRTGQLDLTTYIQESCDAIDSADQSLQALLPEIGRRERLLKEAAVLRERYPEPALRPPLYGILLGVKDIFSVAGFATQGGSHLPAAAFVAPEAPCVTALRAAGALVLGKTVTTEFAYFEPGPTRNPYNLDHTPGGSSSGSAVAVAAGFCPLALGTQTIGSTIRPAAFCGIVGWKPSYGRIATEGVIACAGSFDTVGLFTQDVAGLSIVAPLLCQHWREVTSLRRPVLAVPEGPYLAQASQEALQAFEQQLRQLQEAGYLILRVAALQDIVQINARHTRLMAAEMARVHALWFAQYAQLYRPRTAALIREGQQVSDEECVVLRRECATLRDTLHALMAQHTIDLWVCPASVGAAPLGIAATGSPFMNLPWTSAGLPALNIPAAYNVAGLPLGLQLVGAFMQDEQLLAWAAHISRVFEVKGY